MSLVREVGARRLEVKRATGKDLKRLRETPCLACGSVPSDVAHVKSVGAGGKMFMHNLIPLCRADHIVSHQMGWSRFFEMHPQVKSHLEGMGWTFENLNGRFLSFHADN